MWKDKADQAAYHARWYADNRKKRIVQIRASNDKIRARNRAFVLEHLVRNPCVDCGEADPVVLEFDHVRGKKLGHVTTMAMRMGVSLARLKAEIEKCEVRCANCHRRVTAKRRKNLQRRDRQHASKAICFDVG